MIAIGIWLIVDGSDFDFITEKDYASPAAILIATGVITTVISIVGVIGALGMWYCVLVVVSEGEGGGRGGEGRGREGGGEGGGRVSGLCKQGITCTGGFLDQLSSK